MKQAPALPPMRSTFKPALVLMSGRIMSFVATFFIPFVLVRIFSTSEFGAYKQVFLLYATIWIIAQVGMAESLYYFLPRAPEKAGKYIVNSMLVLIAAGLFCWVIVVHESARLAALLGNAELTRYMPLLGLNLLLMIGAASLENVMISRREYTLAAITYGVSDLVRAAAMILPALLLRDLYWVLVGSIVFGAVRFAAALLYFRKRFGDTFRPDPPLLREQFAYAVPFALGVLVENVQGNLHQYMVSHYFTVATFAIYSVGCLQIPLVDFLASPSANVMMVHMSEEIREGRTNSVISIWHDTTRKLALVFFPLFAVLVINAHDVIVFLFTERYAASIPIFMIWSATILSATMQAESVLRVYAQIRFLFLLKVLSLVIVSTMMYPFLSRFGLKGAVFITLLASLVFKVCCLIKINKQMQSSAAKVLPWGSLAAIAGATVASSLIAVAVQMALNMPVLLRGMIVGCVFAISYLVMLMRFGVLRPEEKYALTNWAQRFTSNVGAVKEIRTS
jgi:O-antigen/teichoic acid export membrane protein